MFLPAEYPCSESELTVCTQFVVDDIDRPMRLDRYLRRRFVDWGRQATQQTIGRSAVAVNGRTVWLASWQIQPGDRIAVTDPPPSKPPPMTFFDDIWLVADDGDLLAVNKPPGLLSHAKRWGNTPSLLDLAQARFGPLTLFHRLDRDTSGIMLLTRGGDVNSHLSQAFQARQVTKEYLAVVRAPNSLEPAGTIDLRIGRHRSRRDMMTVRERGGQIALTHYVVLATRADRQLVQLWPETGRTHQLRVHLAAMDAPILGDRLYGNQADAKRLLLHAHRIVLPVLGERQSRSYAAPAPPELSV